VGSSICPNMSSSPNALSRSDFTVRLLKASKVLLNWRSRVLLQCWKEHSEKTTYSDKCLIPHDLRSSVKAGAIGGKIFVAATGLDPEDIVGAAIWFGPGQDRSYTEGQRNALNEFIQKLPYELR